MAYCRIKGLRMLLAIDIGNTRTKWAIFNDTGEIHHQDACMNNVFTSANLSPPQLDYNRIVISNVAGALHAETLTKKIAAFNLPIRWVKATNQAGDVLNRYLPAETLGSDRWAALIAAWHMQHRPCIVVNAGTAVTIDALCTREVNQRQYGEFIGGLILPGLTLMQQSLGLATAQLPTAPAVQATSFNVPKEVFAKNTTDAIYVGALLAISGATQQMARALKQHSQQEPCIIVSGGNGQTIKDYLTSQVTNQVLIVDNLVLKGLYLIEKLTPN